MTYRVRNIAIAVGLALVAAMLTTFYVTNYKRSVQQGESQVKVYVAAKDIAAGVSGAELGKGHKLRVVEVTKRNVVAGAISDADQVSRLVLTQPLYQGEQVTLRRFANVQAQGVRAQLKGTMRAVQVPGDPNQMLLGTLKAGDHVDVVGNFKASQNSGFTVSRVVLRNLAVLQAPVQPAGANVAASSESVSAIIGVRDTQVPKLFYTLKNGDWTLQLRPVVDPTDSSEHIEDFFTVLHDGVGQAAWSQFLRNLAGRQ